MMNLALRHQKRIAPAAACGLGGIFFAGMFAYSCMCNWHPRDKDFRVFVVRWKSKTAKEEFSVVIW